MKYFTPDLHVRTSSTNDSTANAAHAEWEKALERYERRLTRIRPALSPGVRQLIDGPRLHDAQLLYLGRGGDRCYLALQTDQIPATIVSLEYSLVGNPVIERNALPADVRAPGCLFLYDEVDVTGRDGRHVYSHSILFTNGLHIRVKFSDVVVRVVDSLVQIPQPKWRPALSQPA